MAADFSNERHLGRPPTCCHSYTSTELDRAALAAALAAARGALRVTEETAGEEGQLAVEMTVLDRLLYQSTGQHRMQKYFQGLAKVKKCVKRYLELDIRKELSEIAKDIPSTSAVVHCVRDVYLPSRQMLQYVLVRLHGVVQLLARTSTLCSHTYLLVEQQTRMGLFVPKMILFAAMLSRIWAVCRILIRCFSSCYGRLQPLADELKGSQVAWLPDWVTLPESLTADEHVASPNGQATEDLPHTVDSSHLDDSQAIVTSKAADAPVTSSAAPAPTATVTTLTDATTNGEDEDVGTPLCRDRRPADTAGDTSGPEGLARWRGRAERCGDIAALIEVSERFAGVCGERGARRARDAAGRLRAVQETGKGRSIVVKMMTRVYDCGWRQREQGGATEGGRGGGKTGKSPRMPAVNTLRAGDKGSLTKVQIKKSKKNKLKDANRNDMKTRVVKPGDSDSGGAGQERKVKKSLKRKRAQTVEAGDHGVKLYDERVLKSVKLQTAIKTKRTKKKNLQMDLSN